MSLALELRPETEGRLRLAAAARGVTIPELVEHLVGDLPPPPAPGERVPGLSRGKIWISEDFDEPLPDSFWLGAPPCCPRTRA